MIVGGVPLLLKSRGTDWENAVNALSPTAWWRLGEASGTDALDENGTYDGTYLNSPTLNQSSLIVGDPNPSVRFDGSNDLVTMGDVLNPGTSDFSVVIWVNADDLTNGAPHRPIQKRGTGGFGTQAGWAIGTSTAWSNTAVDAGDGSYVQLNTSTYGMNTGETHMLTLTWSNSNERLKLYIDDTEHASGTLTGSMSGKSISNSRPMTIGCADNGGGTRSQFWDGFADESLFFLGTELTASDVSDLYTAGS